MLLLAVDTSDRQGSIALASSGNDQSCEIIELLLLTGGLFSAELVPQIGAILSRHAFRKEDIDALAVNSGPGSFTGLRIGLAAVKGISEGLQKPIAPISRLEAIAFASTLEGRILAALDAGRGEVYAGEYHATDGAVKKVNERMLARERLFSLLQEGDPPQLVTPDQTLADLVRTKSFPVLTIDPPRSDLIARLGWRRILAGNVVTAEGLEANYVRIADSELYPRAIP